MNDEYSLLMSPQMRGTHCGLGAELEVDSENCQTQKIEKLAYQDMVVEAHRLRVWIPVILKSHQIARE